MTSRSQSHSDAKVALATKKLVNPEDFATSIEGIASGIRALLGGRLKINTIVLLIAEKSGVTRKDVRAVLEAAVDLDRYYLQPGKDTKKK